EVGNPINAKEFVDIDADISFEILFDKDIIHAIKSKDNKPPHEE
ncbi:36161_t:CDS:1, partial [Racocetra persica]